MYRLSFFAILSAVVLLGAATSAVADVRHTVKCDKGDSLQQALDRTDGYAGFVRIAASGRCEESVTITRDRIEIIGDGNTVISGTVRVFGSDNVSFSDLTITGPGDGLLINNSRIRLDEVRLTDNEGAGISLDQGGALWMSGGEVSVNAATGAYVRGSYAKFLNTQVTGNSGSGISATGRATVHLEGGAVSHNGGHGVDTTFNSSLFLSGTELSNNGAVGGYGAYFSHGSSGEIQFATIAENRGEGVEAYANSSININGGSIFANDHNGVSLGFGSVATLRDVYIYENSATGVTLWAGSGLLVYGDSSIPPNDSGWSVDCDGKESSLRIHDTASVPAINCSDPEF